MIDRDYGPKHLIFKYFWGTFFRFMLMSILPMAAIFFVYSLYYIPKESRNLERDSLNSLSGLQETITMIFNDTSKVSNLLDTMSDVNLLYRIMGSDTDYFMDYDEFSAFKQLTNYMNAIVNSRTYIESIYVYYPNESNRYFTNQMNIWADSTSSDSGWIAELPANERYSVFRRRIAGNNYDTLTVVEKSRRGFYVAVNFDILFFERMLSLLNPREEQSIILADGEGHVLAAKFADSISFEERSTIISSLPDNHVVTQSDIIKEIEGFTIFSSAMDDFGIQCFTAMANRDLFSHIYDLLRIMIYMIIVCGISSIIISLVSSSLITQRMRAIVDTFSRAKRGKLLYDAVKGNNDIYSYIYRHLIQTFIKNEYMRVSLKERTIEAKYLELAALQYQINPHFLYNSLQMIDFEVLKVVGKPTIANEMIEDLSRFLQYSLRRPEENVMLEDEIEATKFYTNLMRNRMRDRIAFRWNINDDALDVEIPKLILQPLIENSIQHGIQQIDNPIVITIDVEYDGKSVKISVRDNGSGISEANLRELKEKLASENIMVESHIGLRNVIRRLRLGFGDRFSFFIDSKESDGFEVTFVIELPADV